VLRLNFGCKKLPNLDTFTRTDGMAVLFEKKGTMWAQLGMTEVIMDSLDPEWVKCFEVPYKFEETQKFKVVVYDIDDFKNLNNFRGHDLVGELEFTLHEIVTAKD
jgi:GGDEF domain-containing protein